MFVCALNVYGEPVFTKARGTSIPRLVFAWITILILQCHKCNGVINFGPFLPCGITFQGLLTGIKILLIFLACFEPQSNLDDTKSMTLMSSTLSPVNKFPFNQDISFCKTLNNKMFIVKQNDTHLACAY